MRGLEEVEKLSARHQTLKRRQTFFQAMSTRLGQLPGKPKLEKCRALNKRTQAEIHVLLANIKKIARDYPDNSLVHMYRRGRRVIREVDFEELYTTYKDHHRMMVFVQKGCACIHPNCTRVGTRLLLTVDNRGEEHIDLFTDTWHLMTNDHIVPKSRGGGEEMSNKQPLCEYHNQKKSNHLVPY